MGTIIFQLPAGLDGEAAQGLHKACLAGGPDAMPWPAEVRVEPGRLVVRRDVDDSGFLMAPWKIPGSGRLMGTTTTLAERPAPYPLVVELARGKVHQVRSQAADWEQFGLRPPEDLSERLREATRAFGRAARDPGTEQASREAGAALALAYEAGDGLLKLYTEQMFAIRHVREPRLKATLACRLGPTFPPPSAVEPLSSAFNAVALPFGWKEVEPAQGDQRWEPWDALVAWAAEHRFEIQGGPLIDFSSARLPDWLWLWNRDPSSVARFMSAYVTAVVQRYRGRVRAWQVTAASNWATVLGLAEDDLLWLTLRLAEAARRADRDAELSVGLAQPWGEYMAQEDRTHSPFVFADTLLRSGLDFGALDVEVVAGVSPRGSYCRDLLDTSRMLDLYAQLGVPLRVTFGYPSADGPDPGADSDQTVGGGRWGGGFTPIAQADWAAAASTVALCKPWVRGVCWVSLSDAEPHLFPHCGLLDSLGIPKPAIERLGAVRKAHFN